MQLLHLHFFTHRDFQLSLERLLVDTDIVDLELLFDLILRARLVRWLFIEDVLVLTAQLEDRVVVGTNEVGVVRVHDGPVVHLEDVTKDV